MLLVDSQSYKTKTHNAQLQEAKHNQECYEILHEKKPGILKEIQSCLATNMSPDEVFKHMTEFTSPSTSLPYLCKSAAQHLLSNQ